MSQDNRAVMQCSICNNLNYDTTRNPKSTPKRLEMKKFCKHCKKMTMHKETK